MAQGATVRAPLPKPVVQARRYLPAALCLALGLSDIIQSTAGGVEIDALFIDEGFGSLDAAALEQAVAVLTSLSAGSRLVGIISHVEELRQRIDCQIDITKTPSGSHIAVAAG